MVDRLIPPSGTGSGIPDGAMSLGDEVITRRHAGCLASSACGWRNQSMIDSLVTVLIAYAP